MDFGNGRLELELDRVTSMPVFAVPVLRATILTPPSSESELEAEASAFVDAHKNLFGVSSRNLSPFRAHRALNARAWRIVADQVHEGIPLLGGFLYLKVDNDGNLLLLEARLFPPGSLSSIHTIPALDEEVAKGIALSAHGNRVAIRGARLVIAFNSGVPFLAWQVELGAPGAWRFTIDANSGEVTDRHDLALTATIQGNVKARGTLPSSLLPDVAYNPPTINPFPLPRLVVSITSGANGSDETSDSGDFSIPDIPDGAQITVQARLVSSTFEILNDVAAALSDVEQGTTGTFFTLLLNSIAPTEFTTSQVNAFVWMEKSRNFAEFLYTILALSVPERHSVVEVNSDDFGASTICNGAYIPDDQLFFGRSIQDTCVNAAYSTFIAHEFGHHFQREIQLALHHHPSPQGAGGMLEGTADVFAAFLTMQPVMFQDFFGQGSFSRDLSTGVNGQSNEQFVVFPVQSDLPHDIGLTLGGSFVDLLGILQTRYGSSGGEIVAKTFYVAFMEEIFLDKPVITEIDERVGERMLDLDQTLYGGFYRDDIVAAFHPHNLYRPPFIRGDVNASGAVDIVDHTALCQFLFSGGAAPLCFDAADVNDDAAVNVTDCTLLGQFLWSSGQPPAPPFPGCGRDPPSVLPNIKDFLTCAQSGCPD
jgi:hypothetical protein